ncbi:hypothetical protein [Streptomyces sp. NPDC020489]|uniref:hypothetical protein n=1 Tax=Streptomyces sp. NPDC020489 TaxID=3365077 RepID=UPI0037AA7420
MTTTLSLTLGAAYLLYAALALTAGRRPGAPAVLRLPYDAWSLIAHARRRPTSQRPRPDYERIAALERELGLIEEHPLRSRRGLCLVKNCTGDTEEVRTWNGHLVMRIHHCNTPRGRP